MSRGDSFNGLADLRAPMALAENAAARFGTADRGERGMTRTTAPSRIGRAFNNWPAIERGPAATAVIGILEGEGIGPELMAVCRDILDRVGSSVGQCFDIQIGGLIGKPALKAEGAYLTAAVESFCREIHGRQGSVLCGPGGGRFVYDLRRRLSLFCKLVPLRPTRALSDVGPVRPAACRGVDILVVRESLGGLYQGAGNRVDVDGLRRAHHTFGYDETQVEQIIRVGAKLAEQRRGRLCVVEKPGGVPEVSALWRDVAERVCADGHLALSLMEIDNACYQMIANASAFDVVVAANMFGDVLADGAAVLLGSRGMSYSGNFSDDGIGIYQTGHGAAYDLAGIDRANPVGQIHSMVFMLREHFELETIAHGIELAVEDVLAAGWRTADVMGPGCRQVGTKRMGELIAEAACRRLEAPAGQTANA